MLELKERMKCKSFKWFLENVAKKENELNSTAEISRLGEIRSTASGFKHACLDTMSKAKPNEYYGVFWCHGLQGSQRWIYSDVRGQIIPADNDRICISSNLKFSTLR